MELVHVLVWLEFVCLQNAGGLSPRAVLYVLL